jgi:hypothetical protein
MSAPSHPRCRLLYDITPPLLTVSGHLHPNTYTYHPYERLSDHIVGMSSNNSGEGARPRGWAVTNLDVNAIVGSWLPFDVFRSWVMSPLTREMAVGLCPSLSPPPSHSHYISPNGCLHQFKTLRSPVVVFFYACFVYSARTGHPRSLSSSQHT